MKRRLLIIICVLFSGAGIAQAQTTPRSVEATDIRLTLTGGQVEVSFTLHAGKKATNPNFNLVVNPVLSGGATRRQLPSIVIRGKRSKAADARHELATGERRYEFPPVYMSPGESLDYTHTLPFEEWMRGGELSLDGVSVGCCSAREVDLGLIAGNILYAEPIVDISVVARQVAIPQRSTGATLATRYPFIAPAAELPHIESAPETYGTPGQAAPQTLAEAFAQAQAQAQTQSAQEQQLVIEAAREGSISIYFRQGARAIDRNFGVNNHNLVELISAVRALADAPDVRIVKIVIAGFASPEGSPGLNERLAWDRAMAVKEFLSANSNIDPRVIQIYNGGADWTGLRELIAGSDLHTKWRLMEIIDTTPVWDYDRGMGRLSRMMRVDDGRSYRRIAREFFPQLRQAAYIKVYYENN